MSQQQLEHLEATFDALVTQLQAQVRPCEAFTLILNAESSQFTRFNQAKIRQTGIVQDGYLVLTLMSNQCSATYELPCTGVLAVDQVQLTQALEQLRHDVAQLPVDPYQVIPEGNHHSREVYTGKLLSADQVPTMILEPVTNFDFAGFYAAGTVVRAYADVAGQKHWFATDTYTLDYSLFLTSGQAVKGTLAGSRWCPDHYAATISAAKAQLNQLDCPPKAIAKGQYRTYLAPSAVADLVGMMSWGGVSESALQQGHSALAALRRGEKLLSPQFTLREHFGRGLVPRFNELGSVAPVDSPLIQNGKLVNTLVSSRSAKEYNCIANGASESERLRSPEMNPGTLNRNQILAELGTGLYLSNLHYLNWSDRPTGRITGMTRYACFWVEKGEIVAPIDNLRFDESLYNFWGEQLAALTDFQDFVPEVGTYQNRQLGGCWVPGMIVDNFTYTL